MTPEQLHDATGCSLITAQEVAPALAAAMDAFAINTPARRAAFLAQVAHESGLFTRRSENLNYRADRLRVVFPRYFPTDALAAKYAGRPELIGARVYANRLGNLGEDSGDGYRYRGRGFIQVTGKTNYAACGKALGIDLVKQPEQLEAIPLAAKSAAWFWSANGCNELADAGRFSDITRRINGGQIGADERLALFRKAQGVLA